MTDSLKANLGAVADWITAAGRVVVFTGAGVSTESGIPDFRGPGGIWSRYSPITFQEFLADPEARRESWRRSKEGYAQFAAAQPNAAHLAIAELERLDKLDCVITQNVDNLHQRAGSTHVIELHGNNQWVACLGCGKRYPRSEIQAWLEEGIEIPACEECGGILKSTTVAFGQPMPEAETREAEARSRTCDVFIVVGSSLVVYPAAYMPRYAKERGARVVLINASETDFDHRADAVFHQRAGDVLPMLVDIVRARLSPIPPESLAN
ncbi:MAG: NAD-dependent deacylase [Actinobacteria bacterium]|nr:NAD-dependent deacylase [Actinomycetota bacterium]